MLFVIMKIGETLLKKLNKKYEPSKMVSLTFKGYDIALKIDEEGNPIVMFIGKKNEAGMIKGERYARRLVKDASGTVIKDHWDFKGKAS